MEQAEAALDGLWQRRIEAAEKRFKPWWDKAEKIYDRYGNERASGTAAKKRFAMLWSNVRVMQGALYSDRPKPYVARRQKADVLSRAAAQVLERALEPCIELSCFDEAMRAARDDRLLSGRGVPWVSYEANYDDAEVLSERIYVDFVLYRDFLHSEAPTWDAVWWVAKRAFLGRDDLVKRFGSVGAQVQIQEEDAVDRARSQRGDKNNRGFEGFASVWEIWDKRENRVLWYAPEGRDRKILRVGEPPHQLVNFYPCPRPVYSTLAPGSLVPVPDYDQYGDQAGEVDELTDRINDLVAACRVAGVYDSQFPEIQKLIRGTTGNALVPVANWAHFAQQNGLEGVIDFLPLKDAIDALGVLYQARESAKRDAYEISGISDIVRGDTQQNETATAQRIKGQFAGQRLRDAQNEMARLAKDTLAIMAEVMLDAMPDETILEWAGYSAEELVEPVGPQKAAPQEPQQAAGLAPMPMPQPMPETGAQRVPVTEALAMLRDDRMRTFEIVIETDATIAADEEKTKQDTVEFMTAVGGFLEKALMIGAQVPAVVPLLGHLLLFGIRNFRIGRDVEQRFEEAVADLEQQAKGAGGAPQPGAEGAEAGADAAQTAVETERLKVEAAERAQRLQLDAQKEAHRHQEAMAKLGLDERRVKVEEARLQLDAATAQAGQVAQDREAVAKDAERLSKDLEDAMAQADGEGDAS